MPRPLRRRCYLAAALSFGVATHRARADEPNAAASPSASPSPAPAPTAPPAPTAYLGAPPGYRRAVTWDVDLEGAIGSTLGSGSTLTGFGRLRAGVLSLRDANIVAVGASYEYSNIQKATFGVQAEYMNDNSGLWMQLGALVDTQVRPGAMASVGYALFGAEVQLRSYQPVGTTLALYAKLSIPIGFLAYELRH